MGTIEEFIQMFGVSPKVLMIFVGLAGLDAIIKLLKDTYLHIKKMWMRLRRTKAVDGAVSWFEQQNIDTEKILTVEARQELSEVALIEIRDILERLTEKISATENAMKAMEWDRLTHFGMIHIAKGHISNSDIHVMDAEYDAYHACGGNGHIEAFMQCVRKLPITELMTEEDVAAIENNEVAKNRRVKEAKLALQHYYEIEG